jgi:hypothetical protein
VLKANAEDSMIAMKGAFSAMAGANRGFLLFCCCIPAGIGAKCCDLER